MRDVMDRERLRLGQSRASCPGFGDIRLIFQCFPSSTRAWPLLTMWQQATHTAVRAAASGGAERNDHAENIILHTATALFPRSAGKHPTSFVGNALILARYT